MTRTILTALCLSILIGCKQEAPPEPSDHFLRTVSFPRIPLAEGERISGIQIDMTGGRFRAVNRIPNDWSLEIEGPVSERSTLRAEANHGVSWLSSSSNLQGFATVLVCSPSLFEITATICTEGADGESQQNLTRDQLMLTRPPTRR